MDQYVRYIDVCFVSFSEEAENYSNINPKEPMSTAHAFIKTFVITKSKEISY